MKKWSSERRRMMQAACEQTMGREERTQRYTYKTVEADWHRTDADLTNAIIAYLDCLTNTPEDRRLVKGYIKKARKKLGYNNQTSLNDYVDVYEE